MSAWTDFFVASAGAAAALAGLLIVAVSVNVRAILRSEGVPERAAATVATVAVPLAVALDGLVPGQPVALLAAAVEAVALAALALHVRALRHALRRRRPALLNLIRVLDGPGPLLPFVAAGIALPLDAPLGLGLLAAGVLLALLAAVEGGWILLVEILR